MLANQRGTGRVSLSAAQKLQRCGIYTNIRSTIKMQKLHTKVQTPLVRFVDDLYSLLYNKSTSNRTDGVWT